MVVQFRNRFMLFFCTVAFAGAAILAQHNTTFHALTRKEGLARNTNAFVYQDRSGFMWISSVDGLNRFDGRRVKVYKSDLQAKDSLYGSNIQSSFFEDRHGDLWFSTDKAINCYKRQSDKFEHYFAPEEGLSDSASPCHIFHLDSTNNLWVKAAEDLFRFNVETKKWELLAATQAIRFGVQWDRGVNRMRLYSCFWSVRKGIDITEFDPNNHPVSKTTLFQKPGFPAPFDLTIQQCYPQNDSICWFATDKGVVRLNIREPNAYHLIPLPVKGNGEIRSIYPKTNQILIVSSASAGAWLFSTEKYRFLNKIDPADKNGILHENLIGSYVASDSTIWNSTLGEGIYYGLFENKNFHHTLSELSGKPIEQLFEDEEKNIWCLNKEGQLFTSSNGKIQRIPRNPYFSPFIKFSIEGGKLTGLVKEGVEISTTGAQKKRSLIVESFISKPTCLLQISNNGIYVGTFGRLLYVDIAKKKFFKVDGFDTAIYCLFKDSQNHIWAYGNGELKVFDATNPLSPKLLHTFQNINKVNQITEYSRLNQVLVASSGGLRIINPNTYKDTLITEKCGLPNQYIYAIVPDKNGNIWLSSIQGIIKFMPYKPIGRQFKQYTTRNGLSSDEYCPGAALMSSTGEIWFGSTRGVDILNPSSITDNSKPPKLAIVGLKVHDRAWPWDTTATTCIEMANQITLKYNENTLRLELAAMEYTDPEMNKFRVWLSRDDNKPDTVELGTQNFITYANLRPGHYRFGFTACNSEGIWQETPRNLDIFIRPHFTQTWWFPWLVGLLALAVIGFGTAFYYRYRLRLQQLALEKQQREAERKQLLLENELALQEERNRIADEMHDELGGGLSTIRLASQRAKKVQSSEELQIILKRVSQISIGLVNNMRGIIWAMDSQNDSLRSLMAYIRQYAGTFLDDNGIAASLSLPGDFPDRALSSQFRHNIMLTVKECLNNILKHAEATEVVLSASVNGQLQITIRDNGKGFDPIEQSGMGKGLRTTVKRMESVGGSIAWQRNNEGGMTVTLLAPLP